MIHLAAVAAYFVVVFAWAYLWNIVLFRQRYETLAGAFLREPPLFASGMTAILIQAMAMVGAFVYAFDPATSTVVHGLALAFVVNIGSVAYGALVIPGKFVIEKVGPWIALELAYGLIGTLLIGGAMAAVFRSL